MGRRNSIIILLIVGLLFLGIHVYASPAMKQLQRGLVQSQACDTSQFGETGTSGGSLGVAQFATSTYRGSQFVYTGANATQI